MTSQSQNTPFRQNLPLQTMVVWLLVFWLITAINPLNRFDWLLENLLVFSFSILLLASYRRFRFSNTAYTLLTIFMTLHLIGAHYTYAETPFGFWLQQGLDLQRNHYDRIVHFAYGLLLAYPYYELLTRSITRIQVVWACFITINLMLAFSGLYEVIEAIVAMIVSPELGDAYLGTQGDVWDAQWDMGLAFSGAALAMSVTWWRQRDRVELPL
ncbi:MAG: DUF2238 domain-containing protein [Gammaproteobacteria bacterium]|nr:DUF2238 domain-containing protein [Gammaproteobacteria bacterium]